MSGSISREIVERTIKSLESMSEEKKLRLAQLEKELAEPQAMEILAKQKEREEIKRALGSLDEEITRVRRGILDALDLTSDFKPRPKPERQRSGCA